MGKTLLLVVVLFLNVHCMCEVYFYQYIRKNVFIGISNLENTYLVAIYHTELPYLHKSLSYFCLEYSVFLLAQNDCMTE